MKSKWKAIWTPAVTLLAAILYIAPHGWALEPSQQPWLEETLFLGEAVPLRVGGEALEDRLLAEFGEAGTLECRWISGEGPKSLDELSRQRPRQDTDYRLSALLRREDGQARRLELVYRVHVQAGSLRVQVDGPGAGSSVLLLLEGRSMSLYQAALLEADPQGGGPVLAAEFNGLPFGVYTVTVVGGAEQEVCELGVCRDNDTVDPARHSASLRFTLGESPGAAIGESFRLGGRS